MIDAAVDHHDYYDGCTPGYINFEGKANGGFVWEYFYGAGPVEYRKRLDSWFEAELEEDLALNEPA